MAPQGSPVSSLSLVCCPSNTLAPSASGPLHMQFLCLGCLPLLTSFTHGLLLREAFLTPCVPQPLLPPCFPAFYGASLHLTCLFVLGLSPGTQTQWHSGLALSPGLGVEQKPSKC